MKCVDFKEHVALNRHLNKEGSLSQEIMEHIEKCEECKKYYNKMKLVDEAFSILEETRDIKDVPTFKFLKYVNTHSKSKRFYFDKVAIAALFILCLAYFSTLFINKDQTTFEYSSNDNIDAQYEIPLAEDITIDLNVHSKTSLTDVKFTLSLGDGLKFGTNDERYKSFKEFTKKINLKQGDNKLSFAIVFNSFKPSVINAVLSKNGKNFIHKILLEPDKDQKQIKITYLKVVVEKESA